MAIDAAADIESLNADIIRIEAPVSPPLSRAEDPDYRCPGRECDVRRPRVTTDVHPGKLREFVKSL